MKPPCETVRVPFSLPFAVRLPNPTCHEALVLLVVLVKVAVARAQVLELAGGKRTESRFSRGKKAILSYFVTRGEKAPCKSEQRHLGRLTNSGFRREGAVLQRPLDQRVEIINVIVRFGGAQELPHERDTPVVAREYEPRVRQAV